MKLNFGQKSEYITKHSDSQDTPMQITVHIKHNIKCSGYHVQMSKGFSSDWATIQNTLLLRSLCMLD